jgi:RHS repeat-associated protein
VTLSQTYDPFGNVTSSSGTDATSFTYTSEQTDPTGLQYLRARYYDPGTGRFLTKDPFAGYLDLPQSQNPYAYALNNPIRYTDPSGNCPWCIPLGIAGAAAGGGLNLYSQLHNNGGRWECVDWGQVALWAGAGAVAGLMIGLMIAPPVWLMAGYFWAVNQPLITYGLLALGAGTEAYLGYRAIVLGDQDAAFALITGYQLLGYSYSALATAIGNGIQGLTNSLLGGLGEIGLLDEFLPPSVTGQFMNWESLPTSWLRFTQETVNYMFSSNAGSWANLSLEEVASKLWSGELELENPLTVFMKTPEMNDWPDMTKYNLDGSAYSGSFSNLEDYEFYSINNRGLTVAAWAQVDYVPVQWATNTEIAKATFEYDTPSFGRSIWIRLQNLLITIPH